MPVKMPEIPFSFRYGERTGSEVLAGCEQTYEEQVRPNGAQVVRTIWRDGGTGLRITLEQETFPGFPGKEWVLYLSNEGQVDTPLLCDILPLDACVVPSDSRFGGPGADDREQADPLCVLHYATGGMDSAKGYKPARRAFRKAGDDEFILAGEGGRSSRAYLPFFNLQTSADSGLMLAVGWSGQWQGRFQTDRRRGLRLRIGMEKTHLRLHAGETIRSPRILVLPWEGKPIDGHNILRRFLWKYHVPTLGGSKPVPMTWANSWFTFNDGYGVNEINQRETMTGAARLGVEFLMIDAGWYECPTGWWHQGVGNWDPRPEAFPNGFSPVAEHGRKEGISLGIWFEFERATRASRVAREHPEWLLEKRPQTPEEQAEQNEEHASRLVDLGLREVQDWILDYVDRYVSEGMKWFRHDFNIDPLGFWSAADAPDRQGMTEIRYVEGLYRIYDEILRRHPDLIIEGCAGGGHRIDLETVSRNHGYWAADLFDGVPESMQACVYGANLYLHPHLHNTVLTMNNAPCEDTPANRYRFFSVIGGAPCFAIDTRDESLDYELGQKWLGLFQEIRHLTQGEFYPLTEWSIDSDRWMAHQFHRPDLDEGLVVAFRRSENEEDRRTFELSAIDASGTYRLQGRFYGKDVTVKGKELIVGLEVALAHRPDVEILSYSRV